MPTSAGGQAPEPEMDRLSDIIAEFNRLWGKEFTEPAGVNEVINQMLDQVRKDEDHRSTRMSSNRQNAQIEHQSALRQLFTAMSRCHTELYKAYTGKGEFRECLNGEMARLTYQGRS